MALQKTATQVLGVLITVLVVLILFASLTPEVQNAGNSMNDSAQCINAGCFYNTTASATEPCRNADASTACTAGQPTIPLNNIFSGTGLVVVLLMVFLLLLLLVAIRFKGQR